MPHLCTLAGQPLSEPIYKTQFHLERFDHAVSQSVHSLWWSLVTSIFKSDVNDWLEQNNRKHHLINIYPTADPAHMIVVLNDRTTAIMLKLALG